MSLVRSYNPIWYFVDLQGVQLDDTYYFFVLENTFPYVPATVWHDVDGINPWNFPIQFLANGTLPDPIYFDPNLVYRLEVRKGNTQLDPLIYEIDNYVPSSNEPAPTTNHIINTENQISNPNFALINFVSPITINASGTYQIAPDWFLKLTGTGSSTITQIAVSGLSSSPEQNNAPFVLNFANSGWSSAILYQQFNEVSDIWANTPINASITGISQSVGSLPIAINYVPSSGSPPPTSIASGNFVPGIYTTIAGGLEFTPPLNPDSGASAFVQIQIVLPPVGTFSITNVQLISGDTSILSTDPDAAPFIQETIERQTDKLFHYYNPLLQYKQIPSYLVGWDFPLNPAQTGSTVAATAIGANKSKYVWDQTIIFQSANSGVGVSRGNASELLLTAAATTQMAVIQYIGIDEARKILNSPLCVNVSASTNVVAGVKGTVSLWYTKDGSLPNIASGTNNSLVLSLDVNGKPASFNGNWIEVPRITTQEAIFTVMPSATTNFNDYPLSGWDLAGNADANAANFFAIVVGFASVATPKTISLNSVSLNAGSIPTRPAPQTPDEVLRECQYYYEQSYDSGVPVGTASANNPIIKLQELVYISGTTWIQYPTAFSFNFYTLKRAVPNITLYSNKTGASGNVESIVVVPGVSLADVDVVTTHWTLSFEGRKAANYLAADTTTINSQVAASTAAISSYINVHYVADCRLGIV